MNQSNLKWKEGEKKFEWKGKTIRCVHEILWACEFPNSDGFCIVLAFEESTPKGEPNACIYSAEGKLKQNIVIKENGYPVRFLGCEIENNNLFLSGANNTGYLIDPKTFCVLNKHEIR